MALRFRRSIKVAPGVRVNFGKRGVSASAGVRGATVTAGKRGVYGNVGLPGTGLSYRTKLSGSKKSTSSPSSQNNQRQINDYPQQVTTKLEVLEDGNIAIFDEDGNELPKKYVKIAREQNQQIFDDWLQKECDSLNEDIESILQIHIETPPPEDPHGFRRKKFTEKKPELCLPGEPIYREHGIFSTILGFLKINILKNRLDSYNNQLKTNYERECKRLKEEFEKALDKWNKDKADFDRAQDHEQYIYSEGRYKDVEIMASLIDKSMNNIDWPRETLIDYDIRNDGKTIYLDVDLPEIEDMPSSKVEIAKNSLKLNIKKKSDTQIRKDYMNHVHGIGFRVIGDVFRALPACKNIVLSAYSQRVDPSTGRMSDEYLYSIDVERSKWKEINFSNLEPVNVVDCFSNFKINRQMTKTGIFKPIEPIS